MHASAGHVFETLRLVTGAERPLGVAEVARALGLSMSTAHRALMTLQQAGYLRRSGDGPKFEAGRQAESGEANDARVPDAEPVEDAAGDGHADDGDEQEDGHDRGDARALHWLTPLSIQGGRIIERW